MKIILAVDSFKGSLSSIEIANIMEEGIKEVQPNSTIIKMPIADGGEGTVSALHFAVGGKLVELNVKGPLFSDLKGSYLVLPDNKTVVIELAASSGLPLVPEEKRNPMLTTSYGLGETIKDALNKGYRRFIIGIGGSSSNDAGLGVCNALGLKFLNEEQKQVEPIGDSLDKVESIDFSEFDNRILESELIIACDVNNPLYGLDGAAHVFAKQKGATNDMITRLDFGMKKFSSIVSKYKKNDVSQESGSGAAGGLGFAFKALLGGQLMSGIDVMIEALNLEEHLKTADIVITGEGKLDEQTSRGKAPVGISRLAMKYNVPVVAIGGTVTDEASALHEQGISAIFSIINKPLSLSEAMDSDNAKKLMKTTIQEVFKLINVFNKKKD